jgi:MFS family permease
MSQAGAFFGVLVASYVMDRWGRKAGMIYCAFFSLLGGALLCGANGVVSMVEYDISQTVANYVNDSRPCSSSLVFS